MKEFENINDILEFAIDREQNSVDFYNEMAAKAKNNYLRDTFGRFAAEEKEHKAKLIKIKEEKTFVAGKETISDLKIADYMDNVKTTEGLSYQDALVLAMNREKAAFKLYTKLAAKTTDKSLHALFSQLAIEESKHKLMFEIEYDEVILNEN